MYIFPLTRIDNNDLKVFDYIYLKEFAPILIEIKIPENIKNTCTLYFTLNYSEEKGFGRFAKVISEETKEELVEYTKDYINKTTDKILDGKFPINPKYYNGKNVSCEFCEFKDICFSKEKDMVYLEKVEDLSFLGGDL